MMREQQNAWRLFVDMDGVLADFDRGYADKFGPHGGKDADNVDWRLVESAHGFYASLPPMADFDELWKGLSPYNPTILTGVPYSVPNALDNKRAWVTKHIGPNQPIIGCKSKDKCANGEPGDVLIDDWEKYKHLWLGMGGHWITHVSAIKTLHLLDDYILGGH